MKELGWDKKSLAIEGKICVSFAVRRQKSAAVKSRRRWTAISANSAPDTQPDFAANDDLPYRSLPSLGEELGADATESRVGKRGRRTGPF